MLGTLAVVCLLSSPGCATFGGPAMSLQEERRLGKEAQAEVERSMEISRDPVVVNYIRQVGERLVRANDLTQFDYTFDVVETPQVNAFAIPGGHLYVNTGLICLAESEDELAGVMGHEIGHAARRHAITQMTAQQQTQAVALGGAALLSILLGQDPGTVSPAAAVPAQLAAQGYLLKYSRDHEREADDLAVQYLHRAGYDPQAVASFFEKLQAEEPERPGVLAALLSSHPVTADRIEATREAAAGLGPPTSRSGTGPEADLGQIQEHLNCDQVRARQRQGSQGRQDDTPDATGRTPQPR
ncbi:MAG TPA: M48 family metallopeptidase [Thermodesulfobacteriota bacterium]